MSTEYEADSSSDLTTETLQKETVVPAFDLETAQIPSFAALQQHRANVFRSARGLASFRAKLAELSTAGDGQRRKGLGLWMVAEYEKAAEILAAFEKDDVASFTRANALMSLGRYKDALPIFERLSRSYPKEPRPLGGRIEARLEAELAANGTEAARKVLQQELEGASDEFADSPEGSYLHARARELAHDPGAALDHYASAIDLDPTHRQALFRGARLAERCGLDELARRWYQALTRVLPIDRPTLFNLGVLLEDAGRDADAATCYETICKSDPQDRRARMYLNDAREGLNMFYDEDMERKEDRLNQLLRTPITDFELSVRARNCLAKMNIVTLGDLVRHTEQDLLSYKNFGETSLNEIKEILNSKNLRLGMGHAEAVASMESSVRERVSTENSELLNKPIHDLELSIRARRTVENLGCLTVGDILQHSEEELLTMPNFGITSLQELKRKLEEIGTKLPERKA